MLFFFLPCLFHNYLSFLAQWLSSFYHPSQLFSQPRQIVSTLLPSGPLPFNLPRVYKIFQVLIIYYMPKKFKLFLVLSKCCHCCYCLKKYVFTHKFRSSHSQHLSVETNFWCFKSLLHYQTMGKLSKKNNFSQSKKRKDFICSNAINSSLSILPKYRPLWKFL